ncbi:uracil phosphoribosyltransferase [Tritonibacter mobilis]|nr:uracil phosphoribosyltransferase [Tritonibacter mobilis]
MSVPNEALVLCSILRAGAVASGLLNYFDTAENAFISAYRKHFDTSDAFEVVVNYLAAPSIEGKTLILIDPMLATGENIRKYLPCLIKVWNT